MEQSAFGKPDVKDTLAEANQGVLLGKYGILITKEEMLKIAVVIITYFLCNLSLPVTFFNQ